jgi:hypothetical protein
MSRVFLLLALFLFSSSFVLGKLYAQTRFELPDAPKEYEIGGIRISGIQYLDKDILRTYTGLSVGQKISVMHYGVKDYSLIFLFRQNKS